MRDAYDIAYQEAMEEAQNSNDPEAKAAADTMTALMEKLETLEGLEEKVKSMDTRDIMARTLLDQEAFEKIYTPAVQALMKGNPAVQEAARDSALVNARVAQAFHEAYGEPYENIAKIVMGGQVGNSAFNMPANRDVNPDTPVNVVDITGWVPEGAFKNGDINRYIRRELKENFMYVKSADGKAYLTGPRNGDKVEHIGNSPKYRTLQMGNLDEAKKVRQATILMLRKIAENAVLVESVPNEKVKKKGKVNRYHYFYVPVKFRTKEGEKFYVIEIEAEEATDSTGTFPIQAEIYDLKVHGKGNTTETRPTTEADRLHQDSIPSTITIREMLSNVNDHRGYPFINADGSFSKGFNFYLNNDPSQVRERQDAFNKAYNQRAGEETSTVDRLKLRQAQAMEGEIPLSMENSYFQSGTWGEAAERKLAAEEAHWKSELAKLPPPGQQPAKNVGRPIRVMTTPLVFRLLGQNAMGRYPQLPIVIDVSKLQLLRKEHPEMTIPVLEQIPRALANPIMMCGSLTQAGRVVSVLELKDEMGRIVLVPFELNQRKGRIEANIITSIYGREGTNQNDFSWVRKEISANRLLYIDRTRAYKILGMQKSKAIAFLQSAGVRFPMEAKKNNGLLNIKIPDENDLVKLWNANPDLYQSVDQRLGAYDPSQNLIALFNGSNQSTVIHETAHVWLTMLERVAQNGNGKALLRQRLTVPRHWPCPSGEPKKRFVYHWLRNVVYNGSAAMDLRSGLFCVFSYGKIK